MACYIIRAGSDGASERIAVKIGWAVTPRERLEALQTGHHERLEIIRVIDGLPSVERWMQRRFADRHIRGEWYWFCPEMLTITAPCDQPRRLPKFVRTLTRIERIAEIITGDMDAVALAEAAELWAMLEKPYVSSARVI